jgi:hypothetical protein
MEQVRTGTLGRQGLALLDAETVLFVYNHQAQARKLGLLLKQGLGPHDEVSRTGRDASPNGGGATLGTRQQLDAHIEGLKESPEILVLLLGQKLGGRHEGSLMAAIQGGGHGVSGHHGLATPHIPLNETNHGAGLRQIAKNFRYAAILCIR